MQALLGNLRFAGDRVLQIGRTTPKQAWFRGAHGSARAQLIQNARALLTALDQTSDSDEQELKKYVESLVAAVLRGDMSAIEKFRAATSGWATR